ncbi:unnamed protein product, partial [Prunus brigantina]
LPVYPSSFSFFLQIREERQQISLYVILGQNQSANVDLFDAYFRRADLDRDGRISGSEAVAFFQASGLPKPVLAQWLIGL